MSKILKLKRIIAMIVVVSIISVQGIIVLTYASERTNYLAIQANRYILNCEYNINGNIIKGDTKDLTSGLYYFLDSEETVCDKNKIQKNSVDIKENMFSADNLNINCDKCKINSIVAAKKLISLKCRNVTANNMSILFSASGNIVINCDKFDFTGLLYAPHGNITINAKQACVRGCMIAKTIKVKSNSLDVIPDENSEKLISFLESYKNDGYMMFDAYFEDGDLNIYCDSNLNMNSGIVYARFDDDSKFKNIGTISSYEGKMKNIDFNEKIDIIIEGRTVFGEKIESGVVSLEKNEEGEIFCTERDSDNDGVEDGIEMFYFNSNPYNADTDNDGIEDGIEIYYLYTNPMKANAVDEDFDGDGISNIQEIKNGTNPYLADTNFDGKNDNEDENPTEYGTDSEVYEISKMQLGRFDKIITTIDSDGNCTQMVYDFMNDNVKLEQNSDLIKQYYYNCSMKISSKITSYNDEYSSIHYEYEDDNLSAVYNNGYKYSFEFDDKKNLTEVGLNNETLMQYKYTDDSSKVIYANGYYDEEKYEMGQTIVNDDSDEKSVYTFNAETNVESAEFYDSGIVVNYYYDDDNDDLIKIDTNTDFSIEYDKNEQDNISVSNITYTIDEDVIEQVNFTEYNETGKQITTKYDTGDEVTKYSNKENSIIEKFTIDGKEYINEINYNDNSEIESINYANGDVLGYEYNGRGFITKVTKNGNVVNEYEYDLLDRLICEKDINNNKITYYTYDLYDNLTESNTYIYHNGCEGNILSHDIYEYSDLYGDQAVRFNGIDITYDESGKPIDYYNGYRYEWNGDKLARAVNEEKEIELLYDNNGTLIRKIVNGVATDYYIEGIDYIAEETDGKVIIYLYDSKADLIGFMYENNAYYYLKNFNKDIIGIVDSNYELVCEYEYDAWGNVLNISGNQDIAEINKYRYRSYYYDSDIEMYYLHSRFYDSVSKRFISTDSAERIVYEDNNLNLYAYCNNNPVMYYDPEGTAAAKVYIMSLNEFKKECSSIETDFKNYYSNCTVTTKYSRDFRDYINWWNNMSGYNIVVINTHGGYQTLSCDNTGKYSYDEDVVTTLNRNEIRALKYKYIDVLILLGCQTGHYKYWNNNVAHEFSKKISGCVIASDGLVVINTKYSIFNGYYNTELISKMYEDKSEKDIFNGERKGWLCYRYRIYTNGKEKKPEALGIYSLSIKSLMNHLKSKNYYK